MKIHNLNQPQNAGYTLQTLFFLNQSRADVDGQCPILVRILINKEKTSINLKVRVKPNHWIQEYQKMKPTAPQSAEINEYLETVKFKMFRCFSDLMRQFDVVTVEMVKLAYSGQTVDKIPTIVTHFKEYNEDLKKMIGHGTTISNLQKHNVCLRHLQEFLMFDKKKTDIRMSEITASLMKGFEHYLRLQQKCSHNTVVKFIQNMKRVLKPAIEKGWIHENPFTEIKTTLQKVDRGYLTMEEIAKIENLQFDPESRLDKVRDLFVFNCFTGMAYIDATTIKRENLERDLDGTLWIRKHRTKSRVLSVIPILPKAEEILRKYNNLNTVPPNKLLLPSISNQKLNAYLKEIGDLAGIQKRLSSHLARHTFATTIGLGNGLPIETVSKILGHTNLKTTQIYAKIVDSKIKQDFVNLRMKLE